MSAEYRYKMVNGEMKADVFDSEDPPDGWCQSPGEAEKAGQAKKPEPTPLKKNNKRNSG
jgi:hypothetical protein